MLSWQVPFFVSPPYRLHCIPSSAAEGPFSSPFSYVSGLTSLTSLLFRGGSEDQMGHLDPADPVWENESTGLLSLSALPAMQVCASRGEAEGHAGVCLYEGWRRGPDGAPGSGITPEGE